MAICADLDAGSSTKEPGGEIGTSSLHLPYSKIDIELLRYRYPTNSRGRIIYKDNRILWNS